MRRRLVMICAFAALLAAGLARAEPTLEVNASRERLYLGESFLLEVKVGGTSQPGEPDLSGIRGARVESLGSQNISHQSIIIVNGEMRREGFVGRTYTYRITPADAGEFTAGPVSARADGITLSRPGPAIQVTGITPQDIVSISVLPSRETVLVDEPFDVRLVVRIRRLAGGYADVDPLFASEPPNLNVPFLTTAETDGLKGPDIRRLLSGRVIGASQAGFAINDFAVQNDAFDFSAFLSRQPLPARFSLDRREVEDAGRPCFEYSLTLPYTAESEGAYTFGPVLFKGSVPTAVNARGQAESTEIFAVGPAAIVRVVPPPEEGRPESYIGAIGSNLTAVAALDAQTCNVGDPLRLTLTLSGAIQMRNLSPPKLSLQTNLLARFEVYDDTVQTVKQPEGRQYVYTLRPRHDGAFELPPIEVAYYNVRDRRYHTVATAPIPLKVRPSVEVTASQVIGGTTNAPGQAQGPDPAAMQPAGLRMDAAATEPASLTGNWRRSATVAAAGPLVFAAAVVVAFVRRRRAAFARAWRQRRALARARRELRNAPAAASEASTFVCRVMRRYLSDRLAQSAESATPDEARDLLLARGVSEATAGRFGDVMQSCFNAAFGAASIPTVQDVLAVLGAVDHALAGRRARPRSGGAGKTASALLIACLGLACAPATLLASAGAEVDFIWREANSHMVGARTPRDYLAAAATYQKLVDRGVCNATVFYNQATALLLAGKHADAVQVFLRAERYGGSAPDLRRNLGIAQARLEGARRPVTSWQRVALFWHYGLSCAARARVAAVACALLWLAAALQRLGARAVARPLLVVSLIALLVFGASVLTSWQQENRATRPAALQGLD